MSSVERSQAPSESGIVVFPCLVEEFSNIPHMYVDSFKYLLCGLDRHFHRFVRHRNVSSPATAFESDGLDILGVVQNLSILKKASLVWL